MNSDDYFCSHAGASVVPRLCEVWAEPLIVVVSQTVSYGVEVSPGAPGNPCRQRIPGLLGTSAYVVFAGLANQLQVVGEKHLVAGTERLAYTKNLLPRKDRASTIRDQCFGLSRQK